MLVRTKPKFTFRPPATFRTSANGAGPRHSSRARADALGRVPSVRFNPLVALNAFRFPISNHLNGKLLGGRPINNHLLRCAVCNGSRRIALEIAQGHGGKDLSWGSACHSAPVGSTAWREVDEATNLVSSLRTLPSAPTTAIHIRLPNRTVRRDRPLSSPLPTSTLLRTRPWLMYFRSVSGSRPKHAAKCDASTVGESRSIFTVPPLQQMLDRSES